MNELAHDEYSNRLERVSETRSARLVRQRARKRKRFAKRCVFMILLVLLVAIGAYGIRHYLDKDGATARNFTQEKTPIVSLTATDSISSLFFIKNQNYNLVSEDTTYTPIFASYRDIQIHSPVAPADLTELAFHQASYSYALPLATTLPDADSLEAANNQGTGRSPDQPNTIDGAMTGSVLRLYRRGHYGAANTAADIGGAPGVKLVAPIDGVVAEVRPYKLYGSWDDFELHIKPLNQKDIEVVMIHIADVQVKKGDRVIGGVTTVATIRRLDDKVANQLRYYTLGQDQGNHTHLQVNDVTNPEYARIQSEKQ